MVEVLGADRMTPATVSPAELDQALERMAADLGVSLDELLDALGPVVTARAMVRAAEDLEIAPETARALVARWMERAGWVDRRP